MPISITLIASLPTASMPRMRGCGRTGSTQNRDTEAIQIKLGELIRATHGAHNALLDLEELEEDALDVFRSKYRVLAASACDELGRGTQDTGTPEP